MDVYDTLNQRFGCVEQGGNRRSANAASDVNAAIYDPLSMNRRSGVRYHTLNKSMSGYTSLLSFFSALQ